MFIIENISEKILSHLNRISINTILNYLISLPLSLVKIDKYFIWQTDKCNKYIEILDFIVKICHTLNLPVVAEGVETVKQLELLKKLNVDYIQGYLFSKPLTENNAYKLVLEN